MNAQPARASSGLLSIGQVLQRLSSEFQDLSPSKLRFLEDQGLVTPERTPSGYRKFSAEHVDRIRTVLTLQRDHYLPLKVIRTYLEDVDAGRRPQLPGTNIDVQGRSILTSERRLSRTELMEETGATRQLVLDAQHAGVIPSAEPFNESTVVVTGALVELSRFGIEPRHLRGMRGVAEREAALIEQAVKPLRGKRDTAAKARAAEAATEMASQMQVIRDALSKSALSQLI
ncbi:MAG TPA: MerR family transcriptional regulator [Candidatus Agrococcus pullicola]|uniref:MerR family transcriptional regulator n=1 Tax=Candidatus Agrococcus pullicola TaxID=2838429 RepID=A0A9D1YYM1_9MICO|nr:MerR family transcriptional regulator [Candidatus Agrococcus pullicola]